MTATLTRAEVDLAALVTRCRERQQEWQRRSVKERLRPIKTLRRLLAARCDDLCSAVHADLGKTSEETIGGDILPLADACKFLQRQAKSLLAPRRVPRSTKPLWLLRQSDVLHRRPRGVVAIIGTWNYPLFLNGVQIIQALTAGNGVVWKPSELGAQSAALFSSLLHEAGIPEGLLTTLPAQRDGGPALLETDIDHVVFTGSVNVGRSIATRLGQRLISSTLELSGNDAMFVLDDANVPLAAAAAWFGMNINRGQTCIAVRRVFVHETIYEPFLTALQPLAEKVEKAEKAEPVRLALASQARQAQRLVEDALQHGGRLLGAAPPASNDELSFRPTVIADAQPDMDFVREAPFAPIMTVMPFHDLDEALRADARCPLGLGASIFTAKPWRARELAERLRTGFVTVNDVIVPTAHPATPFGGVRDSGWGVTQGAEGLLEMTVPQVLSERGGTYRPHYEMATTGPGRQEALLRGILRFVHAKGFRERWRGFWQMLRGFWKS